LFLQISILVAVRSTVERMNVDERFKFWDWLMVGRGVAVHVVCFVSIGRDLGWGYIWLPGNVYKQA